MTANNTRKFNIKKFQSMAGHDGNLAYSLQLNLGSMVLAKVSDDGWGGGAVWESMIDEDGSIYNTDNKLRDAIYTAVREFHVQRHGGESWKEFEGKFFWLAADTWLEGLIFDLENQKWIQTNTRTQIMFQTTSTDDDNFLCMPRKGITLRDEHGKPTHRDTELTKLTDPKQPQVERDVVELITSKYGEQVTGIFGLRHHSWTKENGLEAIK